MGSHDLGVQICLLHRRTKDMFRTLEFLGYFDMVTLFNNIMCLDHIIWHQNMSS